VVGEAELYRDGFFNSLLKRIVRHESNLVLKNASGCAHED